MKTRGQHQSVQGTGVPRMRCGWTTGARESPTTTTNIPRGVVPSLPHRLEMLSRRPRENLLRARIAHGAIGTHRHVLVGPFSEQLDLVRVRHRCTVVGCFARFRPAGSCAKLVLPLPFPHFPRRRHKVKIWGVPISFLTFGECKK